MFRVLAADFAHETNTFSIVPTTLENFQRQCYIVGSTEIETARRGTKSGFGAAFEAADRFSWTLKSTVCASANPSGRLTNDCFESITKLLLAPLHESKFDGVLLMLHGAMVSESFEDAEGEILRRCRELVGPSVPIMVTLDLHGNITQAMADFASALIAVRTYPHIDFYEMAWKAAELLQRSMLGELRPATVLAKRPMLKGLDGGRTQAGPMRELIDRGEALEREGSMGLLVVSICAGFTAADIRDIGPSVTVSYDASNNPIAASSHTHDPTHQHDGGIVDQRRAAAQAIAEEFMDVAWETRAYTSVNHLSVSAAVELMLQRQQSRHACGTPSSSQPTSSSTLSPATSSPATVPLEEGLGMLLLAEVTDNPGSGHYGDATAVLWAMLQAQPALEDAVFYAIFDPDAVRQGMALGVGGRGAVKMGGRHDVTAGGGPIEVEGTVVSLTDGCFQSHGPICGGVWQTLGPSMLFRASCGVDICVISNNAQALDTSQVTSLGVDLAHKRVVVVKSAHHFRAHFGPYAQHIATVDGGGLGSVILASGTYVNARRPIWPLDKDMFE